MIELVGDSYLVDCFVTLEEVVADLERLAIDLSVEIIDRKKACDLSNRHAVDEDRS